MSRHAVIVSPAPYGRDGGVERHCALVGEALTADGWTVEEVGPGAVAAGVWSRRLGLTAPRVAYAAGRAARGRRADLVITNGTLGAGAPGDVPRIHVFHGTMAWHVRLGERNLPVREVWRRGVSQSAAEVLSARGATTVAVAEQVAREVRRTYRRRIDRVIPLGVDLARFVPHDRAEARRRLGLPADAQLALYVGRIEHRKGGDLLEPVCAAAGATLVVAGRPAPATGIGLGQVAHDELPWAYAAADAVLFPTRYEGFGYVSLEALACGRPIVTTPTGWAADLPARIPGFAPFVVAPETGALAAALQRALAGGQDALLAEAGALVREEHALATFAERWTRLAAEVAGAAR